jgi:transposase
MSRRRFTREFKISAVKLVQDQGYTIGEAAKSLGVDPATIRSWLVKFPSAGGGEAATGEGALRAEVRRLREENKRLLLEREILKKATAFFAKEQP